mmetsp:Transcript_9691/g.9501  ORF Transcript_9691/g.9501 Transcript_9691/m.9501 type:complete len:159 (-) Transcript_9691:17-493(-)
MAGVSVAENSLFLLATLYFSKYARELSKHAKYFGYWKKISEKEANKIKNRAKNNEDTTEVIEFNNKYYVGACKVNNIHNKPGETLTYLLYVLFHSPEKTYMTLLICQSIWCLIQLLYTSMKTHFLFPLIQSGLSVFVLWYALNSQIFKLLYMSEKRIY